MDDIDRQLIGLLRNDARASVASLAKALGVARGTVQNRMARLAAAGCQRVSLETAVDNASAISFYKRHGYFLAKTVPRYYSNGVDALVLEKDLPREN